MFWSAFIALQHLFMFKYHVKVKFLIPIHKKKYLTLACLLKVQFIFQDIVELVYGP